MERQIFCQSRDSENCRSPQSWRRRLVKVIEATRYGIKSYGVLLDEVPALSRAVVNKKCVTKDSKAEALALAKEWVEQYLYPI